MNVITTPITSNRFISGGARSCSYFCVEQKSEYQNSHNAGTSKASRQKNPSYQNVSLKKELKRN